MDTPVVLFGAFDRHNLGDLLFPHIAQALLGAVPVRLAGLAARDLRSVGGHRVEAIDALMAGWGEAPARLLHVGGETLSCSTFEAAVMLLDAGELQPTLRRLEAHPQQRDAWLQHMLGHVPPAPYVISRRDWPALRRVAHAAIGGVDLGHIDEVQRDAVLARLREADALTVRDRHSRDALARHGIAAALMPDPVVLVAELFGTRIAEHARHGEPAALRAAFPAGYLAVQCSAVFGDDATLDALAAQLALSARESGLGIVLLRAGAAPWHDDLGVLLRLAQRLPAGTTRVAESLDLWDVCALFAGSAAVIASSLHGRIVATAFALPRISLQPGAATQRILKLDAWVQTWEPESAASVVMPAGLADALATALREPRATRAESARQLAAACRAGYAALLAALR
ncbi:polysaccharide pyruvyl transferase family protein [Piscinibacter sp.]|uniref:polysaccharide pyruvyl transferase family protein n=1 Tax=Piscinibacter sp. TaxID=1903157 RepID=UPI0035B26DBD